MRNCSIVLINGPHQYKSSFIVSKGEVISGTYNAIEILAGTDFFIMSKSGEQKWGILKHDGQELFSERYTMIQQPDKFGFIKVDTNPRMIRLYTQNPLYGLLDKNGDLILPANFKEIIPFNKDTIAVKLDSQNWNIVKRKNKIIADYLPYDDVLIHSGKYLIVTRGKKKGLVSWHRTELLEINFDDMIWAGNIIHCSVGENKFDLSCDPDPVTGIFPCVSGQCPFYYKMIELRKGF